MWAALPGVLRPFPFGNTAVGRLRQTAALCSASEEPPHFSTVAAPFYTPTNGAPGSLLTRSPTVAICGLLGDSRPDGCEVTWGFDLRLPDGEGVGHPFVCLLPISMSSLEKYL